MKQVIVQVVQHLRPGGIETMALDLMRQLDTQCEVHIFSLEGNSRQAEQSWPRLEPWHSRLHFFDKQPGLDLPLIWQISQRLKLLKASAIHSHHIGPLLYGGIAARLAGIKTQVHTEHDAWHLNAIANRRLQRWLIRLLQPTLVADCEAVARELKNYFPASQPRVILNGIDVNRFIPADAKAKRQARVKLQLPEAATLIGCAARLETVKGHQFLLQALSRSPTKFTLVLAGDGTLRRQLEQQAEAIGIQERVVFLGALDNMVPFYQAIDLFCLPSLNEGLPLSPLEAQASGVPVIVSDVGGCDSIVCDSTGELVPPADAAALQRAIVRRHSCRYLKSPRQFVLRTGNLEKTAQAYLSLLNPQPAA